MPIRANNAKIPPTFVLFFSIDLISGSKSMKKNTYIAIIAGTMASTTKITDTPKLKVVGL